MRVLLVAIPSALEGPLRTALSTAHDVLTMDDDSRDLDRCQQMADCDVIVQGNVETDDPLLAIDHACWTTWNLLTTTRAKRVIQISTMRMFDAYDPGWDLTESWYPRPSTDHCQIAPYLAEIAAREVTRSRPVETICLRLDEVVDAETFSHGPVQPTWLHIDDAIRAITQAVSIDPETPFPRWRAINIVRGDATSRFPAGRTADWRIGFTAEHVVGGTPSAPWPAPRWPAVPEPVTDLVPPRRAVIYGAGGPLAAITARTMEADVALRLCDLRPLAGIAAGEPQSPGAPLPIVPQPPHEERTVDVTNPDAVLEAAREMDTIINCSVVRPDPVQAFRVNVLGAWNVMQAAIALGIRRVVHTGPTLFLAQHPAGFNEDRRVVDDAPSRPGDDLYFITKFLGTEICRILAEHHRIACVTLLFNGFTPQAPQRTGRLGSFTITWDDAGRAMSAAARIPSLSEPFRVVQVRADSPHDRYARSAAHDVLDWAPSDRLDHRWYRS